MEGGRERQLLAQEPLGGSVASQNSQPTQPWTSRIQPHCEPNLATRILVPSSPHIGGEPLLDGCRSASGSSWAGGRLLPSPQVREPGRHSELRQAFPAVSKRSDQRAALRS